VKGQQRGRWRAGSEAEAQADEQVDDELQHEDHLPSGESTARSGLVGGRRWQVGFPERVRRQMERDLEVVVIHESPP
jgi:hypothetical protein